MDNKPKFSVSELVDQLKAAEEICKRYEKSVKMYDGTINNNTYEFNQFEKYNAIYSNILAELEKKLSEIWA